MRMLNRAWLKVMEMMVKNCWRMAGFFTSPTASPEESLPVVQEVTAPEYYLCSYG